MCQSKFSPFACIIPPYIQNKLMDGDAQTAAFKNAVHTVSNDVVFRSRRKLMARLKPAAAKILTRAVVLGATPAGKPNREVYTANNQKLQPGVLVRAEGDAPVADTDVNNVYEAAGATWDFYYSLFGRNSIDDQGLKLVQTVHYDVDYANAFWDGQQMVYGDGDKKIFGSFTEDLDIIGHELTHGVVQYECNLVYMDESGALNESLADIFGIMIKQKLLNEDVHQSNWLIGENVLIGAGYALRSLKDPGTAYVNHPKLGTDPQPKHMNGYMNDPWDNGGVHLNSGITNHAFYLAALKTGGYAWEKIGKVWYAAMCDKTRVLPTSTFAAFRDATLYYARQLFGSQPAVEANILAGWNAVGL